MNIIYFHCTFFFFELWMYANTFTEDLENTEQGYILFHYIFQFFQ